MYVNAKARVSQCSCYKEALRGVRAWAGPGPELEGAKDSESNEAFRCWYILHSFAAFPKSPKGPPAIHFHPSFTKISSFSITCSLNLTGLRREIKVSLLNYAELTFFDPAFQRGLFWAALEFGSIFNFAFRIIGTPWPRYKSCLVPGMHWKLFSI